LCCAPGQCGLGGLTITAAPNPSTAGQKVVISGSTAAGAQVVLWRELAGQSAFLQVAHTTTDAAGAYMFTLVGGAVMTDQEWYVTSNSMRSITVQQQVHALVGLASSAHSAAAVGQAIVLSGRVTPSHAGEVVLIEQRRGATWRVIARPRLGRHSTYAASHRFATTGTVKLRTVLLGDARNARSVSRTLAVAVSS
jgi:hypothetical protein